jgi:hypothetical protein
VRKRAVAGRGAGKAPAAPSPAPAPAATAGAGGGGEEAAEEAELGAPAPSGSKLRSLEARMAHMDATWLGKLIPMHLAGPGKQAKAAVMVAANSTPGQRPTFSRMSGIQEWANAGEADGAGMRLPLPAWHPHPPPPSPPQCSCSSTWAATA